MEAQEEDIAGRVNAYIDTFIDRGECNFTRQFADPFPSSVFLGLMGLPEDELAMFLDMRDRIHHPDRIDPDAAVDTEAKSRVINEGGQRVYEYFGRLVDERTARPTDDIITRFVTAEVGGDKLSREDILDICYMLLIGGLDTVTDALTCTYAFLAQHPEHRRLITEDPNGDPNRSRGAAPLGITGIGRGTSYHPMPRRPAERRPRGRRPGDRPPLGRSQRRPGSRRGLHERAIRPGQEPALRIRQRGPQMPRPASGPPRAAGGTARVAPSHPGVPAEAGSRKARLPARTTPCQELDAQLGVAVRGARRRIGGHHDWNLFHSLAI